MWLSRKLSQHEMQDVASAQDGTVTIEGGELAVFSSGEKREVKTAAPGGYEWRPRKGENVLVVRGGTFGEEAYAVAWWTRRRAALPPARCAFARARGLRRSCCTTMDALISTAFSSSTVCRIWEWEAEDGAEDQRPRLCG